MSKYLSKEQKRLNAVALIHQMRLEANNPEEKAKRILAEQVEADRKAEIAKKKIQDWMILKMLKGEWIGNGKEPDIDSIAKNCSVYGRNHK